MGCVDSREIGIMTDGKGLEDIIAGSAGEGADTYYVFRVCNARSEIATIL